MHRFLFFTACGLISISAATRLAAEPSISIDKNYYYISGMTEAEIRDDLIRNSPASKNGKKLAAYTTWFVTWSYITDISDGLCAISDAETDVKITFILPELEDTESIPDEVLQKWENFETALLHHENGHKSFGVKAAEEIEETIMNMAGRESCEQLDSAAQRIGKDILRKYRKLEIDYDRKTNHGITQGAIF